MFPSHSNHTILGLLRHLKMPPLQIMKFLMINSSRKIIFSSFDLYYWLKSSFLEVYVEIGSIIVIWISYFIKHLQMRSFSVICDEASSWPRTKLSPPSVVGQLEVHRVIKLSWNCCRPWRRLPAGATRHLWKSSFSDSIFIYYQKLSNHWLKCQFSPLALNGKMHTGSHLNITC